MTASPQSLPDAAKTAIGVAALRAVESCRPDRLFDDPYAQAFVEAGRALSGELALAGQDGSSYQLSRLSALFYPHAVVRTRFYDEYLLAVTAAGYEQIVLLAAGLDARAFRLRWPKTIRLFELDFPAVLDFKQRVLADQGAVPGCRRATVPVDLCKDWSRELLAAGFQQATPTVWLAEGLLLYLSHEEAARMLTRVGELSAPGSRLSFEHITSDEHEFITRAVAMDDTGQLATLLKGGLGEHAAQWLTHHGWRSQIHLRHVLAAHYGRPFDDPSGGGFLTAERN